jgi:hypothetical protein
MAIRQELSNQMACFPAFAAAALCTKQHQKQQHAIHDVNLPLAISHLYAPQHIQAVNQISSHRIQKSQPYPAVLHEAACRLEQRARDERRSDMADTQDFHASTASHRDGFEDEESLTPLEQEVLDEYARLLGNLNNVRPHTPFHS